MKNSTLLFNLLILWYAGLNVEASQPQPPTLEEILWQQAVRETVASYLLKRDLGSLSSVSRGMHEAVEPAIHETMEKVALWESHILNARSLDLSTRRENLDDQAFKNYVILCIKRFASENPGIWIKLNLFNNSLGNNFELVRDLLNAIVTTVHALKIYLAALNLINNRLASLPAHLFDDLHNLQELSLYNNQLGAQLPDRPFEGLNNLQRLDLSLNRLRHLPEHFFKGLNNLQWLILAHNRLAEVPEHLFEGLNNLKRLDLSFNRLVTLPEHFFKNLNLQRLDLSLNQLSHLPECLFEGLNNLQRLDLSFNQLSHLPKRLFEGLNKLQLLYFGYNPLNEESIGLLQALRNRGVDVKW